MDVRRELIRVEPIASPHSHAQVGDRVSSSEERSKCCLVLVSPVMAINLFFLDNTRSWTVDAGCDGVRVVDCVWRVTWKDQEPIDGTWSPNMSDVKSGGTEVQTTYRGAGRVEVVNHSPNVGPGRLALSHTGGSTIETAKSALTNNLNGARQ